MKIDPYYQHGDTVSSCCLAVKWLSLDTSKSDKKLQNTLIWLKNETNKQPNQSVKQSDLVFVKRRLNKVLRGAAYE